MGGGGAGGGGGTARHGDQCTGALGCGLPLTKARVGLPEVRLRRWRSRATVSSGNFAVVDFNGQRKRTHTVPRDLNP